MKKSISAMTALVVCLAVGLTGCPSATSGNSTTALSPFAGTWTTTSGGDTDTVTITSSRMTIELSDAVGNATTGYGLASTVSSSSTSLDVILKVTSVASSGVSNNKTVGTYYHFTFSLSGSVLTAVASPNGESTATAAQADTPSDTAVLTKS